MKNLVAVLISLISLGEGLSSVSPRSKTAHTPALAELDAAIWCGIGGWNQEQSDFAIDAWNCYFKNNIATLVSISVWRLHDNGLISAGVVGDAQTPVTEWIKNVTSTQNWTVSLNVFADWCTFPGMDWLMDPQNQAIEQMVSAYLYTGAIGIDLDIECDTVPSIEWLSMWLSWQSNLSQALAQTGGVLQGAVDYWELDPNTSKMVADYYRLVTMSTYQGNNYTATVAAAKLFQNRVGDKTKAGFAIDICSSQPDDICIHDLDVLSNITAWVGTQAPSAIWSWGQNTIWPDVQEAYYSMLNNNEKLPVSKQCPGQLPGEDVWGKIRREQRPYSNHPRGF